MVLITSGGISKMNALTIFNQILIYTIVAYPVIGGLAFIISSIYYWLFIEKSDLPQPLKKGTPFISIFIPAHNEEASIEATIRYLATQMNYPIDCYEMIVINDGSTDQTAAILKRLQAEFPERLRTLEIVNNRGKAAGFNAALAFAKGEFILSNDADTKPEADALWKYMYYFERPGGQRLGGVTGNMLSLNKTTLVAQAQHNELNSIIGLIKRSQLSYGGLFAFSGANTMYRRAAVLDVGGWQAEQPTEDIAIAWDMQMRGWRIFFAAHIRFFMDVPEKLGELVKQRQRWSSGGIYVLLTKTYQVLAHPLKNITLIPIAFDYGLSIVWSVFYWLSVILFVGTQIVLAALQNWDQIAQNFAFATVFISIEVIIGVIQLLMSSYFNDQSRSFKYVFFAPWYLIVLWMVNTYTITIGLLPTLKKVIAGEDAGSWKSPERSQSVTQTTEKAAKHEA